MIEWYYRDTESCEVGPLTTAEFRVCVSVGEIVPDTVVWRSGLARWTTYADLLAREDEAAPACQSRQARRAPWSSSYHTLFAMGISPLHRQPARARVATSGCTPHGVAQPVWPEHLVESAALPECPADPILDRSGADAMWLGRQFMRLALAGTAFVLVHAILVERSGSHPAHTPPLAPQPTVVFGPLRATLSANSAAAFSPATEWALPAENAR